MTTPLSAFTGNVIYLDTMLPYMLLRGVDPAVKHFFQQIERGDLPHLTILDVLASDLEVLNEVMVQYHLRPRDALHLAAMQRIGCFDLASNDVHFDSVPHVRRYSL